MGLQLGRYALGAFGVSLVAGGAAAQSFDNANGRFVRLLERDRVEAVTDFYAPDTAGVARNSFAVGETGLCTASFIAPMVIMTAAHCRDAALKAGVRTEAYASRSMAAPDARALRVPCQRLLATAEHAVGADLALFECAGSEAAVPPPGAYLGYVAPSALGIVADQAVYSLWRNPVTDDPVLGDAGMSTLVSPGFVRAFGVLNGGAGPAFPACDGAPGQGAGNPVDSQIVVTDQMAATGASGSLSFDPRDDRVVIGPASTGNALARTGLAMDAAYGLGLPQGDRMLFEVLPPDGRSAPPRVPTRFRLQHPRTGAEVNALATCTDVTALHRLSVADSDGDRVHDVVLSETAWDWVQPQVRFDFSDPLVRARWGAAANLVRTADDTVRLGDLRLPASRSAQAVRLEPGQSVTLLPRFNTLGSGAHRVTVDAAGVAVLGIACGDGDPPLALMGGRDGRNLTSGDVEVPCDHPRLTLTARDTPVTLYALSFLKAGVEIDFAFAESRDMWASTLHPFALFTGDGTPGEENALPPTHFALNVTPEAPVALTGALLPETGGRVRLRVRAESGGPAVLRVGDQKVPLSEDWEDTEITVSGPGLTLALDAPSGAVAFVDSFSLLPRP